VGASVKKTALLLMKAFGIETGKLQSAGKKKAVVDSPTQTY
jgi:hypothetical protein